MAFHVVVVGAGVGGITVAAALHQAGHTVTVLEKSRFAGEVGAALNLTPNGCRVLRRLGFDFSRAGAVWVQEMARVDGTTLEEAARQPLQGDYCAVHRGDLHSELMRIAADRVTLRLGAMVVGVDVEKGRVRLADGSEVAGDLVVGADGVHSQMRSFVLSAHCPTPAVASAAASAVASTPPSPPSSSTDGGTSAQRSGCSAFRFLLPTTRLDHPEKGNFHVPPPPSGTLRMYIDPTDPTRRRHLVWYSCRNGTLQNFVGVHPDPLPPFSSPTPGSSSSADAELDSAACKELLLREFDHFHPHLRAVLDMATEVRLWPLNTLAPLPRWSQGRVVLIGDAAHPMLPFSGQGANQAIEDAGALGFLLSGLHDANMLPQRLVMFERVRRKRASRVQLMSQAVAGREGDVRDEVSRYCEDGIAVPTSIAERFAHDALFDVYEKCQEALDVQV